MIFAISTKYFKFHAVTGELREGTTQRQEQENLHNHIPFFFKILLIVRPGKWRLYYNLVTQH
jgi:hypothetical protein